MRTRSPNSYFTNPLLRPSPALRACSFEEAVEELGLTPAEYITSEALKHWVRRNMNHKYVPSELLEAWGLIVSVCMSE